MPAAIGPSASTSNAGVDHSRQGRWSRRRPRRAGGGSDGDPQQPVVDPRPGARADRAPEAVAVVGDEDRRTGGVLMPSGPGPAQVQPLALGPEDLGQRVEDGPQLRVAVALALDGLGVEAERDVVDEHAAVDLGEVDPALADRRRRRRGRRRHRRGRPRGRARSGCGSRPGCRRRAGPARRRPSATTACEPSPPAIASASAPSATAPRTSCSRSVPSFSSIGSMPRARASSARWNFSAFPPPDLGL